MSDRLDDSIFGTMSRPQLSDDGGRSPEPPGRAPQTRAQRRAGGAMTASAPPGRGRPPRQHARRRLALVLIALLVIVGGGYAAMHTVRPVVESMFGPKDYEGEGSGSVQVVIEPGATGREIAQNLADSGVVMTAGAFEDALTSTPGRQIQPGTYAMHERMSAASALSLLRDDGSRQVVRVTIPEGKRATEVFALLAQASDRPVAEYTAVANHPSGLGLPAAAQGHVEGFLFPATYSFDPGDSAADQLAAMVAQNRSELERLGVPPAQQRRVVILASMIEMEARLPADRPKVARVLENRLAQGMPLQLDSTVKYVDPPDGKVTTTDAQRAARNDFNTYVLRGLPAGPISNPGRASLEAAVRPADGPWLYFVTVDPLSGETRFATTMDEHSANVRVFQAWCQANPGHC